MRVTIRHPVPLRWIPPRATASRLAFQAVRTPIEIPEVPSGTIGRDRRPLTLPDGTTREVLIHAGRCWRPATMNMVGILDMTGSAATPAAVSAFLSGDDSGARGIVAPLTPLAAGPYPVNGCDRRGENLPEAVLARARHDNTDAARAALAAHVAERFLVEDGILHVLDHLPRLAPHQGTPGLIGFSDPQCLGLGPSFEPARLSRLPDYMRDFGRYAHDWRTRAGILERLAEGIPYPGDDLRVFLNDGPAAALRLLAAAGTTIRAAGGSLAPLAAHVARLEPHAELGTVGAIAPEDLRPVAEATLAFLEALRELAPPDHAPAALRWLTSYLRNVALPELTPAPVPAEDADLLSGLAPGP